MEWAHIPHVCMQCHTFWGVEGLARLGVWRRTCGGLRGDAHQKRGLREFNSRIREELQSRGIFFRQKRMALLIRQGGA